MQRGVRDRGRVAGVASRAGNVDVWQNYLYLLAGTEVAGGGGRCGPTEKWGEEQGAVEERRGEIGVMGEGREAC